MIVDELHAFAENKRGAHLAVSLERLVSGLAREVTELRTEMDRRLVVESQPEEEIADWPRRGAFQKPTPGRWSIIFGVNG